MKKQLLVLTLISLFVALTAQSNATSKQAADAPAATPSPISVHISDFAYAPSDLTVHVGQTVAFVNDDDVAHTVTASDKSFDSKDLASHATWTHTFTQAGTYAYICAYHPGMAGRIIVTPQQ